MNNSSLILHILLLIVLLIFSAFFSSSEVAFFSLSQIRLKKLREKKTKQSNILSSLINTPHQLIITILIGNEFVNVAASAMMASLMLSLFGSRGEIIAIISMFLLLLIFGEFTPKVFAVQHAESFALFASYPLNLLYKITFPIRWILQKITTFLIPISKKSSSSKSENIITEDEFKILIDLGQDEGILEKSEKELIYNVFELSDTTVFEVMTSKKDMFCLEVNQSVDKIIHIVKKNFCSRIPVYEKNIDNIVGILYAKDLLGLYRWSDPRIKTSLKEFLHPPYFVSKTKKVAELLKDFQKNRIHIAVVVDEHKKTIGLVSMEDLLEELFGEIEDEFDAE